MSFSQIHIILLLSTNLFKNKKGKLNEDTSKETDYRIDTY